MMPKPTWLIEDKYVIMKIKSSNQSKLESPTKSPPLVTPFIYQRTKENSQKDTDNDEAKIEVVKTTNMSLVRSDSG